jgi:hypothetical protein
LFSHTGSLANNSVTMFTYGHPYGVWGGPVGMPIGPTLTGPVGYGSAFGGPVWFH